MPGLVLAVDVGATWLRVAIAREGVVLEKVVEPTPRCCDENVVAERIYEIVARKFRHFLEKVEAVGVGTIGPLDMRRGVVVNPPNLPLKRIALGEPLQERFKKPVIVVNDCVAAVWGERVYGVGVDNLVYVTLSTGVGGGMVIDGHLLLGKDGNAHEIGHMVVDPEGKMVCGCGGRGHWEAYSGGANIPRFARYLIEEEWRVREETPFTRLVRQGSLRTEDVFNLARRGDIYAKRVVEEVNRYNLIGFVNIVNLYDPEAIVVGGSVALKNKDLVLDPLRQRLVREHTVARKPDVVEASFGDDEVLVGAAAVASKPPEHLLRALRYLAYWNRDSQG